MVAIPGAVVAGGISLLGGLFGNASQASAQRAARRDAQRLADYENETNLLNWEYANTIRDFEYKQSLRIYDKSKEVYGKQLGFNQSAAARSYEAENRKMREYLQGMAFQKQDGFIQMLQAQGKAQAGSTPGRSSKRLVSDVLSQYGRNNAILAENLLSRYKQQQSDIQDIALQKEGADLAAYERLGLKPLKPPAPPKPIEKPVAGGSSNPLLAIGGTIVNAIGAGFSYKSPT
jgi:hypothetical protein